MLFNMKAAAYPIWPENDAHLLSLADGAGVIVAAWGANGTHKGRDAEVRRLLPALHCLALTKDGHPGHPLYLLKTLTPVPMVSNALGEGRERGILREASSGEAATSTDGLGVAVPPAPTFGED